MEISCQTEDGIVHHQIISTVEQMSEFINLYSCSDYYLQIQSVTYHLLKTARCALRDYPKIILHIQGRILPQELLITYLDDFHYFLSQHPSQQYLLEINSIVFKMQKLGTINNANE
jgi:hypothetical protein